MFVDAGGNFARREVVRGWQPRYLVQRHNSLVLSLIDRGTINEREIDYLLAMEQEGVMHDGKFHGKIIATGPAIQVSHKFGISSYNPKLGKSVPIIGMRNLQVWEIMNK